MSDTETMQILEMFKDCAKRNEIMLGIIFPTSIPHRNHDMIWLLNLM